MVDLYRIEAGPELDRIIHERVFHQIPEDSCPGYSTSRELAQRVLRHLIDRFDSSVVTGRTRSNRAKRYFARYGSDPSTSTEVLAETFALAVCRLAAIRVRPRRSSDRDHQP